MRMIVRGVLVSVCVCVLGDPAARADRLDRELLQQVPGILKQLKEMNCRHVGVLKFLVQKDGDANATDTAGTLNLSIAQRLELALILANENSPRDVAQQVGIIQDASAVAATLRGADYRSADGRKVLFAAEYPLAWGNARVKADAFLTGVVRLSADRKQLRLGIYAALPSAEKLQQVARFTASADASALAETGESFTRGLLDKGQLETVAEAETKTAAAAAAVKQGAAQHPILTASAPPVALEIYYNDRRMLPEIVQGEARVPEPAEGTRVKFVLRRLDRSPVRLGVVLKVNGENTLFKQRRRDVECTRWILDAGDALVEVAGFQLDGGVKEAFRILSRADSRASELYYGADVGMITMTVFRAKTGKEEVKLPSDEEQDEQALTRGVYPEARPETLARLKEKLREAKEENNRGVIVGGEKTASKVSAVTFEPDPTPVQALTIRYYTP